MERTSACTPYNRTKTNIHGIVHGDTTHSSSSSNSPPTTLFRLGFILLCFRHLLQYQPLRHLKNMLRRSCALRVSPLPLQGQDNSVKLTRLQLAGVHEPNHDTVKHFTVWSQKTKQENKKTNRILCHSRCPRRYLVVPPNASTKQTKKHAPYPINRAICLSQHSVTPPPAGWASLLPMAIPVSAPATCLATKKRAQFRFYSGGFHPPAQQHPGR